MEIVAPAHLLELGVIQIDSDDFVLRTAVLIA